MPWSAFWERNYFFDWSPFLTGLMTSNYTRGAISGLGLVNVWASLAELADIFGGGRDESAEPQSSINSQTDFRNPQS